MEISEDAVIGTVDFLVFLSLTLGGISSKQELMEVSRKRL